MCGYCCGGTPKDKRGAGHVGCMDECHNAPRRRPAPTVRLEPVEEEAPPETVSATSVRLELSVRDAQFAVEHLRFLVERDDPTTADHAAATLSTRWLADQIETAMASTEEREHPIEQPGTSSTGTPR